MDELHVDIFGLLPVDDLPYMSTISRGELDSYCTYPYAFIPCARCKRRELGRPLCCKCQLARLNLGGEDGDEMLRGRVSMLELVARGMRTTPSSSSLPLSAREMEKELNNEEVSEWDESVMDIQKLLAEMEKEGPYVDKHWVSHRAPTLTYIKTLRNRYRPYPESYIDSFWDERDSGLGLPNCCDDCCEDEQKSMIRMDYLPADSDGAPPDHLCSSTEDEGHTHHVITPRMKLAPLRAVREKSHADESIVETSLCIRDHWDMMRRWLAVTTERVAGALKRWLLLILDWIKQRTYIRMCTLLAATNKSGQQQFRQEDEDVD
ncbi:hypothetical protein F4859DRAFT_516127 [Xylaria cf. heliscus]|nr:hypothetical protein F4859DRAFT_516127 [Xylaria cf. heliscus]